jgi:hypothetical protein
MQVSNPPYIPILTNIKAATVSPTVTAVDGKPSPESNKGSQTSVESVNISDAARTKMLQELSSGEMVDFTGEDGAYKKGLMTLGSETIQGWKDQGLGISDEAIIAAGEAFQQGFSKIVAQNGDTTAGSSLALNKHQIMINSQPVPDWFMQEYESTLAAMDDKATRNAFEKGATVFASMPSSSNLDAVGSYARVANNSSA